MRRYTAAGPAHGPVLDPAGAVGWHAGIMDGLNCTQRCIEAVLRFEGRGPLDVVHTFAAPLDLLHRRSPDWTWPGCRIDWYASSDPEENWALIGQHLARGRWPLVMVDRYHWPGDEHEARRHVQSYVVLVLRRDGRHLVSLGVHGDERLGYRHHTQISSGLPLACWRVGLLELGPDVRPGSVETHGAALAVGSLRPLAEDVAALRSFADAWSADTPAPLIGWPLGTMVFSDLEPQTYLLAAALQDAGARLAGVRVAASTAAQAALRLGLVLLEANRSGDADAYRVGRDLLARLLRRLEELLMALEDAVGRCAAVHEPGPQPVLERLATIIALCYPRELGEAVTADRLRHCLGAGA